jgi:hypothetical protein
MFQVGAAGTNIEENRKMHQGIDNVQHNTSVALPIS